MIAEEGWNTAGTIGVTERDGFLVLWDTGFAETSVPHYSPCNPLLLFRALRSTHLGSSRVRTTVIRP